MLAMADDGRLQVTAAISLLEKSLLVEWDSIAACFTPIQKDQFEQAWRHDVDPVFGRLICWIMFAAGSEFLAKGVCLVRGIEIRTEQEVPCHPSEPIQHWAPKFQKDSHVGGMMMTTFFGTLSDLTTNKKGSEASLSRLCTEVCATHKQKELLLASYDLLRKPFGTVTLTHTCQTFEIFIIRSWQRCSASVSICLRVGCLVGQ